MSDNSKDSIFVSFFKAINRYEMFEAIIMILFGIILLINPLRTTDIICKAIGIVLLAVGAVQIISYLSSPIKSVPALIGGIVVAVVGIAFIIRPGFFTALIGVIMGLIILFGGIRHLQIGMDLNKLDTVISKPIICMSVISIILAVLIFARPQFVIANIFVVIGICSIYNGIQMLIASIARKKYFG